MPKFFKFATIFMFVLTVVGIISASENPERDPKKSHLLTVHAMITNDFSGLEIKPITMAFKSWMKETSGDITIAQPTQNDAIFYEMLVKGESPLALSEMAMSYPGDYDPESNPWREGCRNSFYVMRTLSDDPLVQALDNRDDDEESTILAFTHAGCLFKYIVVVADRMENEQLMYTTVLHELGHMWGLYDNTKGQESLMNGVYPMAPCITKADLADVYEVFGKKGQAPKSGGCVPIKATKITSND